MELNKLFNQHEIDSYAAFLKSTGLSNASIKRKLSSLSTFQKYLTKKKYINQTQITPAAIVVTQNSTATTSFITRFKQTFSFRQTNGSLNSFSRYLIITTILLLLAGLSYGIYTQFISKASTNLAYTTASSPVRAGRHLSFQGRLTDSAGTPITTSIGVVFKLFDTEAVGTGTSLYSSDIGNSQTITPDDNGIFSVVIGKTHGTEIPNSVFTENASVFLEITAGGETMTPRQPIATVAYALNSETLQGLPPSASGLANTVLVIDELGNLNLGETSPTIKSTAGTMGVEGQALLLKATDGSGGNIEINPDASGIIKLTTEGVGSTAQGFISATNANLTTGNLYEALIRNTNRGYNFIEFNNYNIGTTQLGTRFSVSASGNLFTAGNLNVGGTLIGDGSGLTGITASAITFDDITTGTNTSALMTVGTGSSLSFSGTGIINANRLNGLAYDNLPYVTGATDTTLTRTGSGPYTLSLNLGSTNTWTAPQTFTANSYFPSGIWNTSGFVGIGTTNPDANLSIRTAGQNAVVNIYGSSSNTDFGIIQVSSSGGLANPSNRPLVLQPNAGYVGIGNTAPSTPLEVRGAAAIGGRNFTMSLDSGNANATPRIRFYNSLAPTLQSAVGFSSDQTGDFAVLTSSDSAANWSQKFIITNDGKVGIGNTLTPAYMLHVAGDALISSRLGIGATNPNYSLYTTGTFGVGSTAYFASSVGIGTTSPFVKLQVEDGEIGFGDYTGDSWSRLTHIASDGYGYDTQHNNASILVNEQGSTNEALILGDVDGTNNSVLFGVSHSSDGVTWTPKFTVTGLGNVGIGTTSPAGKLQVAGGDIFFGSTSFGVGHTSTNTDLRIDGNLSVGGTIFGDGSGLTNVNASEMSFDRITSGTNTSALMTVGTGSSLTYTGNGVINASQLQGYTWSSPAAIGIGTANTGIFSKLGVGNTSTAAFNVVGDGNITTSLNVGTTLKSANLYTTGNVGIGTSSPSELLEVSKAGAAGMRITSTDNQTAYLDLYRPGVANIDYRIKNDGGTALRFYSSADNLATETPLMSMLLGGNVGIGTTTPVYKLQVTGEAVVTKLGIGATSAAAFNVVGNGNITTSLNVGTSLSVGTKLNVGSTAYFASSVGIGITSPRTIFDISGSSPKLRIASNIQNTGDVGIELSHSTYTGISEVKTAIISRPSGGYGRGDLHFVLDSDGDSNGYSVDADTKLIIKNDTGNVGIGTTAPAYKLHVMGSAWVNNTLYTSSLVDANDGNYLIDPNNTGNSILVAGNVGIGTTSPAGKLQVAGGDIFFGSTSFGVGHTSPNTDLRIDGNLSVGGTIFGDGSGLTNVNASEMSFDRVTSGTNTQATMIVGTGASLSYTGSGILNANQLLGYTWSSPGAIGNGTASTGLFTKLGVGATSTAAFNVVGNGNITTSLNIGTSLSVGSNLNVGGTITSANIYTIGNVGIGTTNPHSALEVRSNTNAELTLNRQGAWATVPAGLKISTNDAITDYWTFGMQADSTNNMRLRYNTNEFITILTSGNIGIGTTNPQAKLDVTGELRISNGNYLILDNSATGRNFGFRSEGENLFLREAEDTDRFYMGVYDDARLTFGVTNEILSVTSANVGIGTTAPLYKLQVAGEAVVTKLGVGATSTAALNVVGNGNITTSLSVGTTTTTASLKVTSIGTTVADNNFVLTLDAGTSMVQRINTTAWDKNASDDITTLSEGNFIDISGTGVGRTIAFDPTELATVTWGSNSAFNWTFDAGATDPQMFFGSNIIGFTNSNIGIGTSSPTYKLELLGSNSIFKIGDTSGNTLFEVTESSITSNLPTNFTSSGDVSIAYDLNFTNPTASFIKSQSPLYIQTNHPSSNIDLILSAANSGSVVVDDNLSVLNDAYFGIGSIGTTTANVDVRVDGNLSVGGTIFGDGSGLTNVAAAEMTFDNLLSGTNTQATMIVGTGASLSYTGSGILNANQLLGYTWSSPGAIGNGTASTGLFTKLGVGATSTAAFNVVGNGNITTSLNIGTSLSVGSTAYFASSVGIGTTSPNNNLHIYSGADISPSSSATGQLGITGSGYSGYIALNAAAMYVGHNSGLRNLTFQTDETDRMTITGTGNVGIGTTNPSEKLHVIGTIRTDGSIGHSYQNITTSGDGDSNKAILAQDYSQWIWNTATNWGLFWAGDNNARYSAFGTVNPNELAFARYV